MTGADRKAGMTISTAHCDHQSCIEEALAAAEALCARRGARLTPLRRRVLALVWHSHEAVKAYDLLDRLREAGVSARPPTVYRALDFLLAQGLIHRVESRNAFVGCPRPQEDHLAGLLICEQCGRVDEMEATTLSRAIARDAGKAHFKVHRPTIEIHGLCHACCGEMR